jgi:uncharacterized glyoxalase superfamily protein PhnB
VFGFRELLRQVDGDGRVRHVDLELDGGVVMVEPRLVAHDPGEQSGYGPAGSEGGMSVMVHVADVDRHCAAARAAGARVVMSAEDRPWGLRRYRVLDYEGHLWEFVQHLGEAAPQDWGAVVTATVSATEAK